MPRIKKTRIAIFPNFGFDTGVATYFSEEEYEIVPIDMTHKNLMEHYSQEVYGEWCYPVKLMVAAAEKAVREDKVEKIIGVNIKLCRYPFVLGDLKRWIKQDFEYYPFSVKAPSLSIPGFYNLYKQLHKVDPKITLIRYLAKLPTALKRLRIAEKMQSIYYKNLPLVNNPPQFKKEFHNFKHQLIKVKTLKESQQIRDNFKTFAKSQIKLKKPKNRLVLSGDFSIYATEFPLFDLDLFLEKHNTEIVMNYAISKAHNLINFSKYAKLAKKIIAKVFSSSQNKVKANDYYLVEIMTLAQFLQDLDRKVDGVIFIKPNMCAPCENLSYILKENKYFEKPVVEISYDEHSGVNGIMTRLEAFLNIVEERRIKV